jgi:hypothetical protein
MLCRPLHILTSFHILTSCCVAKAALDCYDAELGRAPTFDGLVNARAGYFFRWSAVGNTQLFAEVLGPRPVVQPPQAAEAQPAVEPQPAIELHPLQAAEPQPELVAQSLQAAEAQPVAQPLHAVRARAGD